MAHVDPSELSAQERAALALWLVMQEPLGNPELADRLGMTADGARVMMCKISRVVPICYVEHAWRICWANVPAVGLCGV